MTRKKQRMTFTKTTEVLEQQHTNAEKRAALQLKVNDAKEELTRLKQERQKLLVEGIESGKDQTEKLNKLADQIADAESSVLRREQEAEIGRKFFQSGVNKVEFKEAFDEYRDEYKVKEIDPLLEAMRKNKAELTKLYREYKDAINHYEGERNNAKHVYDPTGKTLFFGGKVTPNTRQEVEYYLTTLKTLEDLERGVVPSGVELDNGQN